MKGRISLYCKYVTQTIYIIVHKNIIRILSLTEQQGLGKDCEERNRDNNC